MIRIDNLVAKFNTEFVLNVQAVKQAVHRGEVLDFSDKTTLYKLSNRCGQVAQMYQLKDRGYISHQQNIELQTRTKGYAIDKVMAFMERCKAAGIGTSVVVDNSEELEALRAQVAKLQANNTQIVTKLNYEREQHANTKYELNRVENKLEKAERKLSIMMGIKVAQAAYMHVAHGVIQKVRG